MIEELMGCEPLSQVWFVHDYIQLQFQDRTLTILNEPRLHLPSGEVLARGAEALELPGAWIIFNE